MCFSCDKCERCSIQYSFVRGVCVGGGGEGAKSGNINHEM